MAGFVRKCPCLRPSIDDDVSILDYRHCSLTDVPGDVFNHERTLEELLVDSNQIRDLPRELFYCHGLRKLSISDNEITNIPPAISSLASLEEFDLSKNGIIDVPENIKCCKYLQIVDASVNPLGKLPDGITQLLNLTQLCLNDTFLDYLPGNFGRLTKLKILEIRENHLKTLPKSFSRLTDLERLDIGHNEFTELPDVVGNLVNLLELWCDQNQITRVTPTIGALKQLMFMDASKNNLMSLPQEIDGCSSLADLHLTSNCLQSLPESIGNLTNLTTLKVDDNQLLSIPRSIGGLHSLSELNISANELEELPPSLGLLRNLRTFYADENLLTFIPSEVGSCSGITVLSLRSNKLEYMPDEIGRIPRLRVLNLCDNRLKFLPFSILKLKQLQALWLAENQTRPLVDFQSDRDHHSGHKVLTCYLLPQQPQQDNGTGGDGDSFHGSTWDEERCRRQQIQFEFGDDLDPDGKFVRRPTPYPKEMREKLRHVRNLAMRQVITTNGDADWKRGEENLGYEKEPYSASGERISKENRSPDVSLREARITKSTSLAFQETHKLYRCDKEKSAKDKARMQHHRPSQEHADNDTTPTLTPRSLKKNNHISGEFLSAETEMDSVKKNKKKQIPEKENQVDNGGFTQPRNSDQLLMISTCGTSLDVSTRSAGMIASNKGDNYQDISKSFSYFGLTGRVDDPVYYRQSNGHIQSHQNHNRHSCHRRMREYDSDTGYRSDHELIKFQKQQMISKVGGVGKGDNYGSRVLPQSTTKKDGRSDGYFSDIDGYSSSTKNAAYKPFILKNDASSQSLPHGLNENLDFKSPPSQYSKRLTLKNGEVYNRNESWPKECEPSSPNPFHEDTVMDHSTPVASASLQTYNLLKTSPINNTVSPSSSDQHQDRLPWKRELFTVLEHRFQESAGSQKLEGYRSEEDQPKVPPPYKSAPPYTPTGYHRQLPQTPNKASPSAYQLPSGQMSPNPQSWPVPSNLTSHYSNSRTSPFSKAYPQTHHNNECYKNLHCNSPRTLPSHGSDRSQTPASNNSVGEDQMDSPRDSGMYFVDRTNSPYDSGQGSCRTYDGFVDRFSVMTKYEDIEVFKSSEPPSQVSSSTDSGYGQGQHGCERPGGSNSLPSSRGLHTPPRSSSNYTSSPSRDNSLSRETTPVHLMETDMPTNKNYPNSNQTERFCVTITKNPGLGFSIAGGIGSYGNPYRPGDTGIFVTKVLPEGPSSMSLLRGDKIVQVNGIDFTQIDHNQAVSVMKNATTVSMIIERV